MPSALAIGTKKTLKAVPAVYKSIFSREYLGNADTMAAVHHQSKARFVAQRVLIAVGLTVGAPIMLPVAIGKGIHKNTRDELAKRAPQPPIVAQAPPLPVPTGPQDHARNLLISRGISSDGAAAMVGFVYGQNGAEPDFSEADLLALASILEEDPGFSLAALETA
jgi:hypothetical protein